MSITEINSNSWAFEEARKILTKIKHTTPSKGYVLFETGYGPSGLPHIGTFGEVSRTTMVMRAFQELCDIPTKLICFSDDLDGLRKIPDNIPSQEMVKQHLGKSLTAIPDPFGTDESFGHHMNARLRAFLDHFGFDYEFKSATECYKSGMFDIAAVKILEKYDEIMQVMLPTLGAERQATYSPFLPICKETGVVLQVPVTKIDLENATITYKRSDDKEVTTKVTGGNCKLQWKADWAMRWYALEVDYEMYGKDLIPTAELSTKICNIMGKPEPVLFNYELFLDEKGQKISKSKGNGLTIDEWLKYAPKESLSLYMYQSPRKAKRLYFDVIPRNMDDYLTYLSKYKNDETKYDNPIWHIHGDNLTLTESFGINFSLLLNLASACNPDTPEVLWGFISRYSPNLSKGTYPLLDEMVKGAIFYYEDFVKPNKKYDTATDEQKKLLSGMKDKLLSLADISAESIQNSMYDLAREFEITDTKILFQTFYSLLLGEKQGPRIGTFIALYGINETVSRIDKVLNNQSL
jgi:lysyl-tRNA synthetase, class I